MLQKKSGTFTIGASISDDKQGLSCHQSGVGSHMFILGYSDHSIQGRTFFWKHTSRLTTGRLASQSLKDAQGPSHHHFVMQHCLSGLRNGVVF